MADSGLMKLKVEILYSEDCPHTPPTIELVRDVARELRFEIDFQVISIGNLEEAKELNFLGSPTVKVNGLDIDPNERSVEFSGFS
jgi:hypothetical protein